MSWILWCLLFCDWWLVICCLCSRFSLSSSKLRWFCCEVMWRWSIFSVPTWSWQLGLFCGTFLVFWLTSRFDLVLKWFQALIRVSLNHLTGSLMDCSSCYKKKVALSFNASVLLLSLCFKSFSAVLALFHMSSIFFPEVDISHMLNITLSG